MREMIRVIHSSCDGQTLNINKITREEGEKAGRAVFLGSLDIVASEKKKKFSPIPSSGRISKKKANRQKPNPWKSNDNVQGIVQRKHRRPMKSRKIKPCKASVFFAEKDGRTIVRPLLQSIQWDKMLFRTSNKRLDLLLFHTQYEKYVCSKKITYTTQF